MHELVFIIEKKKFGLGHRNICLHLFITSPLEGIVVQHCHLQTELEVGVSMKCVVWEVLEAITSLITFIQFLNHIKAKN